jgi:hypothetical protein
MSARKTAGEALRADETGAVRSYGTKRVRGVGAVLAAALALSASYAAGALDLKGIELGKPSTTEQLHAQLGLSTNCRQRANCEGSTMLEGMPVDTVVEFSHGLVNEISVQFDPWEFDYLLKAAKGKWGEPKSALLNVVEGNAYGAIRKNAMVSWELPDGRGVLLIKYLGNDHGTLKLTPPEPKQAKAPDSRM